MSCTLYDVEMSERLIDCYIPDKTLNDVVPQLIPREPVNIDGVKAGFTSVRSNIHQLQIHHHVDIDIDPTNDAPLAVFDGKQEFIIDLLVSLAFLFVNNAYCKHIRYLSISF
jgi:hypothetical protein